MSLTQAVLRDEVARRIRSARPDLRGRGLSTLPELLSAQREAAEATGPTVVSVVARFDLPSWILGTCAFAGGLPAEQGRAWLGGFTRTVFLAGNPANLADRFDFAHVTEDRSVAWTAPGTPPATLRRLLKLFEGAADLPARDELVVRIPGHGHAPTWRALYLATAGMTVAEAMVHLNHLLVEAVLDGHVRPGDQLLVRQVPRLVGVGEPFESLRIAPDHDDAERLRAYAGLTKELPHG